MGAPALKLVENDLESLETVGSSAKEPPKSAEAVLTMGDMLLLEEELNLKKRITGRVDTLRNTILSFVAEHRWELALRELRAYQKFKSDMDVYVRLSRAHFESAGEAIGHIRDELTGLDLRSLPTAKRQEIYERVTAYFDGLKMALNRLEAVENDLKVKDLRATVWIMEALVASVFILVVAAAGLEAYRTMDRPTTVLFNDITNFLLKLVGLA